MHNIFGLFHVPGFGTIEYILLFFSITMPFGVYYNESSGQNLAYSKFSHLEESKTKISTRNAMLVLYTPALIFSVWWMQSQMVNQNGREFFLVIMCILHFLKRVVETLFLHRYSGEVAPYISIMIAFAYVQMAAARLYYQSLVPAAFYEGHDNLLYVGLVLFFVGQMGNLYHHYLQTTWKRGKNLQYVVPHGGMFSLIACPHYFFEIIAFFGFSLVAQDLFGFLGTFGVIGNLFGRSVATSNYYRQKFKENYPSSRKHIIPYLF